MLSFWILGASVLAWRLYVSYSHFSKVPKGIPWSNCRCPTPYLFAQIAGVWNNPAAMNKAYQKYCKKGLLCAVALPFSRPDILLPKSYIRWMASQNDRILSPTPVQHEIVGAKYAFLDSSVEKDFAVNDILRVHLNRRLPRLVPKIMEELSTSIGDTFGLDTEWKEVQVIPLVRRVIAKVTAWLIIGDELCRDDELVDNLAKFSNAVIPSATGLSLFPSFLQPISSRLTSIINHIYMRRALKSLGPYIEQRIVAMETGIFKDDAIDDVLTWHIHEALRKKEPRDGLEDVIACRIFATMFAALGSPTLTMTHTLFNLCVNLPPGHVWRFLEEEGRRVFASSIDQASINDLEYADSAIKETLRLHTAIKALSGQVMQPAGLTLKDHNMHLRQGSRISVSAWGIHHDEDIYPDAYLYDPYRSTGVRPLASDKAARLIAANPSFLGGSENNQNTIV
ncbi:Cytochrome P450 [Fusarium austroafricanum]|uniref:Cytochrome P450 n=1 Tax=Fusarium austroafricanum TaxID=2364996 RepID=A0A8H4P2R7_9HYPO|nr:Cytochrome P450 [Fusarium austroafricanum]